MLITENNNNKWSQIIKEELGVEDSGIDKMIKSVYKLLNLITFITAGEKEVHAWKHQEQELHLCLLLLKQLLQL